MGWYQLYKAIAGLSSKVIVDTLMLGGYSFPDFSMIKLSRFVKEAVARFAGNGRTGIYEYF